jgi:uncharacterized protein YjbI with pentapeptide repeats
MNQPPEDLNERLRQLELENLRLKAEIEVRKATQLTGRKVSKIFANTTARLMVGKGLKASFRKLLDEIPDGKVTKDTISDIMTHFIWRITRIGTFAVIMGLAPMLILIVQTWILNRQNTELDTQNKLLGRQNERLDQQINLEEGNRRSSLILFMSNIMDKMDVELKFSTKRTLSDPLIGRIVSLSQSMRPYRYLENDSLTPRQLSPERGQLLFTLVNSNLDKTTYDKIYARANFNYADLREANFEGAYLRGAQLAHSSFSYANFNNADLSNANLSGAWLERANFRNTAMSGIDLSDAYLRESRMEKITMHDGNLNNADLQQIYLEGDFAGTNLQNVKLQNASLVDVNLDGCYFQSLGWIDSLKYLEVKGLRYVRDIYFPSLEVRKKGFVIDSVYVLRLDPASALARMRICSQSIVSLIESNPKIKQYQAQAQSQGQSLSLIPVKNPIGMEELDIAKDTAWVYRLGTNHGETETTVLWVQYNPKSKTLWEVFPDETKTPEKLSMDKKRLKLVDDNCK